MLKFINNRWYIGGTVTLKLVGPGFTPNELFTLCMIFNPKPEWGFTNKSFVIYIDWDLMRYLFVD